MLDVMLNNSYLKMLVCILMALVLGTIFTAYFAPETMIAITNQVWAMCGW
jgi:hypothetical protein